VFLFGVLMVTSPSVQAQVVGDTMTVQWQNPTTKLPIQNALRSAVLGDTLAGAKRANLNRVYKLLKNGIYWEADRIENSNFPLRIVGEYVNPTGADYPAEIQMMDLRGDGTAADARMITGQNDVTLKNLYIAGRTNAQGVQTLYQPIQIDASNSTFVVDNCIIEQSNFAVIAFTGSGNTITFRNNKFRNLVGNPSTQQWEGRGISIWADQKSVIVENNTFFNVGFTAFQLEGGSAKYLRINHNTFVNIGRQITTGSWFQEAYIGNNLMINAWWHGEGYVDLTGSGRDPRQKYNGLFTIGVLPSSYGPNQGRRIVITKDYAYLNPKFITLYGDTIARPRFVDPVTKLDFLDLYPTNMIVKDTTWLTALPAGFVDPVADTKWLQPMYTVTGATMMDSMWSNITFLRKGVTPATRYFYKPLTNPSDVPWPLPENFSYATTDPLYKAGTDGLPIGDLNWFPTQRASFDANLASNVSSLESIAGPKTVYTIDSTAEAEAATVGGTAAVASTQGLTYFDYTGSGSITWTFTIANAGQYDTKWLVNECGRGQSGPVMAINGTQIHDKAHGWGQFVFDNTLGVTAGKDNNSFIWAPITADSVLTAEASAFTLAAGKNTIAVLGGGWGEVKFSEVDIVKHGATDTLKLKAPDAVPVLVTPGAQGVAWVASGFKFVNLGTAGTITFTLKAPAAGKYHLQTFYQNTGSTQTYTIKEGTTVLATESLAGKADGTGLNNFSGGFNLTAGTHTITVSGANMNIDFVQLLDEKTITAVKNDAMAPVSYDLAQNFPNPFNPTTTINFSLAKTSKVQLTIFNVLGQKVATLVDNVLETGYHVAQFNAANYSSGVYFYRLEAGNFVSIKKMMLLK
jgi:hypothetical protein